MPFEQLRPFEPPQTPPELLTLTQDFQPKVRDWMTRAVRWVEALNRELRTVLSKIRLAVNAVHARVDVLDARVKDVYTFPIGVPVVTEIPPGYAVTPLPVVADSTLVEVYARAQAPLSVAVTLAVLLDEVQIAVIQMAPGSVEGHAELAVPATKRQRLIPLVVAVSDTADEDDLVLQVLAR